MLMSARDKESGDAMSERELIDEIMTLVVAGHETTASALNWTWYLLSQHPRSRGGIACGDRCRRESREQCSPPGSQPQMESLAYTQQVVNEALRLYPPGWLLSRRAIEADVLGGYGIPAARERSVAAVSLAPGSRFWKDPERFWPERFAPEHEAERPRFCVHAFRGRSAALHRRDFRRCTRC